MHLSPSQQQIVDSDAPRILVSASPGSGKSRCLVERVKRLIRYGADPIRIACISYTRNSAKVLEDRLAGAGVSMIGTLHSFLLRIIQANAQSLGFTRKTLAILSKEDSDALLEEVKADCKCLSFTKETVDEALMNYALHPFGATKQMNFAARYHAILKNRNCLTFDSILTFGLKCARHFDVPFDHMLADEVQDASRIDFAIYHALKISNKFWVGDSDQCQPAGTMIRMSNGPDRPIESLKLGDSVQTYCRRSKVALRFGTVTETSSRIYRGIMYSVFADGKVTRTTGNHKWLVKWATGKDRSPAGFCTYLMRKGDYFRVGKTRFFRSTGENFPDHKGYAIGLAIRFKQEKADSIWVLKLHETDAEAIAYEQIVSATYGLPQICFMAANNMRHMNQIVLDGIFKSIPNQLSKAVRCLSDHGRMLDFPMFDKRHPRTRRTVQEIHACNLLPDVMSVPITDPNFSKRKRGSFWAPIKVCHEEFNGEVFSLDIAKYHKYVADGIVTCNSIFKFRGGCINGILGLAADPSVTKFMLLENYRSGRHICLAADTLIKHNLSRIPKTMIPVRDSEGTVSVTFFPTAQEELSHISHVIARNVPECNACAIICRYTDTVDLFKNHLRAVGIPVAEPAQSQLPKDWALAQLAVNLLAEPENNYIYAKWLNSIGEISGLRLFMKAEAEGTSINQLRGGKIFIPDEEEVIQSLALLGISSESTAIAETLLPACGSVSDLAMAMREHSSESEATPGVFVGTMHAAKGTEFHTVFVPSFEQGIIPATALDEELCEMRRLAFVTFTRAADALHISYCRSRTNPYTHKATTAEPSQFLREAGL